MRVISFNANGIRAAASKGFYEWLHHQAADFVCIQETKAQAHQLIENPRFYPVGYTCVYNDAQKKGYSGVAIYARYEPEAIIRGTGYKDCDAEGRYLQFDYKSLSVISLYMPSGTSGEGRQTVKYAFLDWFKEHLLKLKASGRALIICGDYNIAHKPIDLKNWRTNQKTSGFLPDERAFMDVLFGSLGFSDAFRAINLLPDQYTWWSYRQRAYDKNVGWRIDYQVVTSDLVPHIKEAAIYREGRFSDHAPLIIDYDKAFLDTLYA